MSRKETSALAPRLPVLLHRVRLQQAARAALHLVFPPRCICCGEAVASDFGLCGPCWSEAGFILGAACDSCGAPLPGQAGNERLTCDDCLRHPQPWSQGRAALSYDGTARRLILGLKHGDRLDLVRPLGGWLARAVRDLTTPGTLVAPVTLHRFRLLKRRYNQSALLAQAVARAYGLDHLPDLLIRTRATPSQEGRSREERIANMAGAIAVNPRRSARIEGQKVLLIDDVMTSGATFAAATGALLAAGAAEVRVAALARVAKDT